MMKSRNIENRLAYFGALIVLIGVTWAASSAFGAEPANFATAADESGTMDVTIIGAREAMTEAAAKAAEALRAENKFDLDNQLNDLTSTLMANLK
jgi:hypothetical protein